MAKRKDFAGAVQGGRDERAARRDEPRHGGEEQRRVMRVLRHFERQHGIEALAACGQILGRRLAVIDGKPGFAGMRAGDGERRRVGVDPRHGEAEPRHRLGDEPAAAANVQEPEPGERRERAGLAREMADQPIADEAEPHRVEPVQRPELARLVPPARRDAREAPDLAAVDRALALARPVHRLPRPRPGEYV